MINYLNHILYNPDTTLNPPNLQDFANENNTIYRSAKIAIPFLQLLPHYFPDAQYIQLPVALGQKITLLTDVGNASGYAINAFQLGKEGKWNKCGSALFHTSLAVSAIAINLFNFKIAILFKTTVDIGQEAKECLLFIQSGEYTKASKEALQIAANSLHLAFMVYGSLELSLALSIIQATLSLLECKQALSKGQKVDALAHFVMACFRIQQSHDIHKKIELRDELLANLRLLNIYKQALRGREVRHLLNHPLEDLKGAIDERKVTLQDAYKNDFDFGAHFHGLGKALVKGANLSFKEKDGFIELDFKINHVHRAQLETMINEIKESNPAELKTVLSFAQSGANQIEVNSTAKFPLGPGDAHHVHLAGLGELFVGNNKLPNVQDRIIVRINKEKTIYDLHELLTFLNLDTALETCSPENFLRLKIGHLFRVFYPKEATPLERTEDFFNLPIEELKKKAIELAPEMEEIFNTHLPKMEKAHIIDGKVRYKIEGLAEKAHSLGARYLTSALTGAYSNQELFDRTASILKMGLLATETRDSNKLNITGLSPSYDYLTGGADSVYTQLVTDTDIKANREFDELYYYGEIRFIISLEALETGTYQYLDDCFGTRNTSNDTYLTRPGILDFITSFKGGNFYDGNEVMIKERLDPSFITGIVVPDEKTKADLWTNLQKRDVSISKDFIKVSSHMSLA